MKCEIIPEAFRQYAEEYLHFREQHKRNSVFEGYDADNPRKFFGRECEFEVGDKVIILLGNRRFFAIVDAIPPTIYECWQKYLATKKECEYIGLDDDTVVLDNYPMYECEDYCKLTVESYLPTANGMPFMTLNTQAKIPTECIIEVIKLPQDDI